MRGLQMIRSQICAVVRDCIRDFRLWGWWPARQGTQTVSDGCAWMLRRGAEDWDSVPVHAGGFITPRDDLGSYLTS
jgi:hypothetical protein